MMMVIKGKVMKINKIAALVALVFAAGASQAVVTSPKLIIEQTDKEIVDYCKLFPNSDKCKNETDGAGNGGGDRPPK